MGLKERAEEIVESYALWHAGTAFVVGNLGGQFGVDRVALTALTAKMINELCDLYTITDSAARVVHIGSAIGRLTVRGTAIAHTILNWIPFVGPAANSATTYFLTRQAGHECISDIENRRMTCPGQAAAAAGRIGAMALSSQIAEVANSAAQELVDTGTVALSDASDEVIRLTDHEAVRKLAEGVKDILQSDAAQGIGTEFLSHTLDSLARKAMSGEEIDAASLVKVNLIKAVFVGLDLYDEISAEHRDHILAQLLVFKKVIPDEVWSSIEQAIARYGDSAPAERKEALHCVVNAIDTSRFVANESLAFFRALCSRFNRVRFEEGNIPFDGEGLFQMQQKLAFLVHKSGFSDRSVENWDAAERLLYSADISHSILTHIRQGCSREVGCARGVEEAIASTLRDWELTPCSASFISQCAAAILDDEDLLCAVAIRLPMITAYGKHCSDAAYGMHLHVNLDRRAHWHFCEVFARSLHELSRSTGMASLETAGNPELLRGTLDRCLADVGVPRSDWGRYQTLIDEQLFIVGTGQMARLLHTDASSDENHK